MHETTGLIPIIGRKGEGEKKRKGWMKERREGGEKKKYKEKRKRKKETKKTDPFCHNQC